MMPPKSQLSGLPASHGLVCLSFSKVKTLPNEIAQVSQCAERGVEKASRISVAYLDLPHTTQHNTTQQLFDAPSHSALSPQGSIHGLREMSQSTELHVPDGYYPPYAVVTDTDHGAWIIIAVALGITFVIISSLIRIFLRISFVQRPGLDDTFLAFATVGDIQLHDEHAFAIVDKKDRSSL